MKHLLPQGWRRPSGYSDGILADGEQLFVAGMIGWNAAHEMAEGFVAQLAQALENTLAVLNEGGAAPEHMVRMTWYVTDLDAYRDNLAEIGRTYREIMGKYFPVMAVIGVAELLERSAMIEIETTAVIPVDS